MGQIKGKQKSPQNQTNEQEISHLPERELRKMIAKMIQKFGNKMEAQKNRMEAQMKKNLEKIKEQKILESIDFITSLHN